MPQAEPQPLPVRSGKARSFVPAKLQREPQVRAGASAPVHYPVSDGKPMSESDLHADVSHDLRAVLKVRHIDRPDALRGRQLLHVPGGGQAQGLRLAGPLRGLRRAGGAAPGRLAGVG